MTTNLEAKPDLKAILLAMVANGQRAKAEAKAKPKTSGANGKKLTPDQLREMLNARGGDSGSLARQERARAVIRWTDEAIVLMRTRTVCRQCGTSHDSVDPNLWIQRFHKTYGLHFTPVEPAHVRYSRLPRREKLIELTAKVCASCWTEVAPFEVRQASLTFGPENQGVMLRDGAKPILLDLFAPGDGIEGTHEIPPKKGALPIRTPIPATRWPSTFYPLVPVSQLPNLFPKGE